MLRWVGLEILDFQECWGILTDVFLGRTPTPTGFDVTVDWRRAHAQRSGAADRSMKCTTFQICTERSIPEGCHDYRIVYQLTTVRR